MRFFVSSRAAGLWGIAFVVLLLVSAAAVSIPTSNESGERIADFYRRHGDVVIAQQVIGVLALGAFVAFALLLPPHRWLRIAVAAFVVTELATNLVPFAMVVTQPSASTAHTLTFVEDIADAALFVAIALFVSALTLAEPLWLRVAAYVVAAACVLRAVAGPLGFNVFDAVAPLAFVLFMLLFCVRLLVKQRAATAPRQMP